MRARLVPTRPRPGLGLLRAAVAASVALSVGCGSAATAALPPSPPTVTVSMREYRFDLSTRTLHPGRVIFRVVNDGRLVHRLVMAPLPAGFPPIDEQLRGSVRRSIDESVAIRNLEPPGPGAPHGMSESFAFDLARGRYAFLCFFVDPDGVSHATKGMTTEFVVR